MGDFLLEDPWSQKPQNITKCKEYNQSDKNIHYPSFCLFCIFFTITSKRPHDTRSSNSKYSEKHCNVDNPSYNLSKNLLKSRKSSCVDGTFIFSLRNFNILTFFSSSASFSSTYTPCTRNSFCYIDFHCSWYCWCCRICICWCRTSACVCSI